MKSKRFVNCPISRELFTQQKLVLLASLMSREAGRKIYIFEAVDAAITLALTQRGVTLPQPDRVEVKP